MFLLIFSVCSFDTEIAVLTLTVLTLTDFNYITGRLKAGGCNSFSMSLRLIHAQKSSFIMSAVVPTHLEYR